MASELVEVTMEPRYFKRPPQFCQASLFGTRADGYAATSIFLSMMCRVLQVSRSGFIVWRRRPPRNGAARKDDYRPRFALRTSAPAGPMALERLQRDLAAHGVRVGVHRIKRIRRQLGAGAG